MGQEEVAMYREEEQGSRVVEIHEIETFGIREKKPLAEEAVDKIGHQEIDWIGGLRLWVGTGLDRLYQETSEIRGLYGTIHPEKI